MDSDKSIISVFLLKFKEEDVMKLKKCEKGYLVHINGLSDTIIVKSWSEALEIAWRLGGGKV